MSIAFIMTVWQLIFQQERVQKIVCYLNDVNHSRVAFLET